MKYLLLVLLLASCSQQEQSVSDGLADSMYLSGTGSVRRAHDTRGYGVAVDLFMARSSDTSFTTSVIVYPTEVNDTLRGATTVAVETFGEDVSTDPLQGYMQNRFRGDIVIDSLPYKIIFRKWRDENYDGGMVGGVQDSELTIQFETEKKN